MSSAPHCATCTCTTHELHAVAAELPAGHQEEVRQVGREQDHTQSQDRQLSPELRQQPWQEVQGGDPSERGQDGGGFQEEERRSEGETGEGDVRNNRVEETDSRSVVASTLFPSPVPAARTNPSPDQEILLPDDDEEEDDYDSETSYNVIDLSEESSDNITVMLMKIHSGR